jgi:hypothetical protein
MVAYIDYNQTANKDLIKRKYKTGMPFNFSSNKNDLFLIINMKDSFHPKKLLNTSHAPISGRNSRISLCEIDLMIHRLYSIIKQEF